MPATGAGAGPLPWVGVRRYMKGEPVDAFHDGFGRRLDIDPLQREFITFCSYGKGGKYCYKDELDSKNFAKLCRDSSLITTACRPTDIDIIFARVKHRRDRTIMYPQFKEALTLVAAKKGKSYDEVVGLILNNSGGPVAANATKARPTRLHDDKRTYTGVYKHGAPTNVEPSRDLSNLADRSPVNARGVKC
eukprot:jgi/Tetstr1/440371/TSEL_028706.t1